jgi:hypothetical protein
VLLPFQKFADNARSIFLFGIENKTLNLDFFADTLERSIERKLAADLPGSGALQLVCSLHADAWSTAMRLG